MMAGQPEGKVIVSDLLPTAGRMHVAARAYADQAMQRQHTVASVASPQASQPAIAGRAACAPMQPVQKQVTCAVLAPLTVSQPIQLLGLVELSTAAMQVPPEHPAQVPAQ